MGIRSRVGKFTIYKTRKGLVVNDWQGKTYYNPPISNLADALSWLTPKQKVELEEIIGKGKMEKVLSYAKKWNLIE